jgi:hypothetical protein
MLRLLYGITLTLVFCTSGTSFESHPKLMEVLSKQKATKLKKDGSIFVAGGLRYEITFVAGNQIGAIEVEYYNNSPSQCIDQAHDAAKIIVDELQPIGSYLGREPGQVVPTSGKRRYHQDYEKAFEVISIFKKKNCCDIFDRLTFFYWIPIKGKVKSKYIEDFSEPQYKRYMTIIAGEKLEVTLEVTEDDFQRLNKGDIVEAEYSLTNSYAKIVQK